MKNAAECDVCQRHKSEIVPTRSLSSTYIPHDAWIGISMDFIDGLRPS